MGGREQVQFAFDLTGAAAIRVLGAEDLPCCRKGVVRSARENVKDDPNVLRIKQQFVDLVCVGQAILALGPLQYMHQHHSLSLSLPEVPLIASHDADGQCRSLNLLGTHGMPRRKAPGGARLQPSRDDTPTQDSGKIGHLR